MNGGPNGKWLVEYDDDGERNGVMAGRSRAFENYGNACAFARGQANEGYVVYVWYPSEKLVDRDQWMAAE